MAVNVRLRNLSQSFGKTKVLEGIDLDIGQGVFGLLGPNGAGKTTLLRTLATVLERFADRATGQEREHLRGEVLGGLELVDVRVPDDAPERRLAVREDERHVAVLARNRVGRDGVVEFFECGL